MTNLVGSKIKRLTILSVAAFGKRGGPTYLCLCNCGKEVLVAAWKLKSLTSCGCRKRFFGQLTGQRFGRLVVLRRSSKRDSRSIQMNGRYWVCLCDCGNRVTVYHCNLRNGNTRSCGCLKNETIGNRSRTHGLSNAPEYALWSGAKHRAKVAGLNFDLALSDIIIPEYCPVFSDIKLRNEGSCKFAPNSPSLDRVDPLKGYTKDNIWVISNRANTLKRDASLSELQLLVRALEARVSL